jgi:2,4-dienoyl-CoA reductase-like NADH-dependent reductase (Old Yellow Enzyme family)
MISQEVRMLFRRFDIGGLQLENRLVRSATAEHLADNQGRPRPALVQLYRRLVQGGVGLIITGHMYVHPSGKVHSEMTSVCDDDLLFDLAELAEAVHQDRGKIVAQINHGGRDCDLHCVKDPIGPSEVDSTGSERGAREVRPDEIGELIGAFGQAARRVKEAGFDGVQIHAAHGYLVYQFLSPLTNRREDEWGGDPERRRQFLAEICAAVRAQVGPDFPLLVKLGMMDGIPGGSSVAEVKALVSALEDMGINGLEISGGIGGPSPLNVRGDIWTPSDEAYFRPLAQLARPLTSLPILLVGGMRSRAVMEDVLTSGDADLISMSRPLIKEPELPNLMRLDLQQVSGCISGNECWPTTEGEGIACKCPVD